MMNIRFGIREADIKVQNSNANGDTLPPDNYMQGLRDQVVRGLENQRLIHHDQLTLTLTKKPGLEHSERHRIELQLNDTVVPADQGGEFKADFLGEEPSEDHNMLIPFIVNYVAHAKRALLDNRQEMEHS